MKKNILRKQRFSIVLLLFISTLSIFAIATLSDKNNKLLAFKNIAINNAKLMGVSYNTNYSVGSICDSFPITDNGFTPPPSFTGFTVAITTSGLDTNRSCTINITKGVIGGIRNISEHYLRVTNMTPNIAIDGSGNLVYTDSNGVDDVITIVVDGTNYRIGNPNGNLTAGKGTTQDGTEIMATIALVTGEIQINTQDGDDLLNVDFSGGNFTNAIYYNGGSQSAAPGDLLSFNGGASFAQVTHNFTNENDGTVNITGNSTIFYKGLEPIIDNLNVTDRVFNFNGGAETITLNAGGTLNDQIDSSLGESVDFNNPSNSLTINAGTGDDIINIKGVDAGFDADLTINGDDDNDTINFQINATNIGSGALTTFSEILLISADVSTTGTITTTSTDNTIVNNNATVQSTDGNINMTAGTALSAGLSINNATLQTTGAGSISLSGDDTGNFAGVYLHDNALVRSNGGGITVIGNGVNSKGVYLLSGATIEDLASGNVQLHGTGGLGGGNGSGVEIVAESVVRAHNGAININGSGGNGTDPFNIGVFLDRGLVEATGSASITILGTGGAGSQNIEGINLYGGDSIISNGGGINLTGLGGISTPGSDGSSGDNASGISMDATVISDSGNGNIVLNGTGGAATREAMGIYIQDVNMLATNGDIICTGIATDITGVRNYGLCLVDNKIESINGNIIFSGTSGAANYSAINFQEYQYLLIAGGVFTATAITGGLNTPTGFSTPGGELYRLFDATSTEVNGLISPGQEQSIGNMYVNGDFSINLGSTYLWEITRDDNVSEYDQILITNGTVDVTDATLSLFDYSASDNYPEADEYVIIDNDGTDTIIGNFNGLPNNTPIFLNEEFFYIFYDGGDGNDIVLVVNSIPTANCQDITVQLDTTGNVTILPSDIDNGSSDPNGPVTLSLDIDSFTCEDLGSNTVTLTVTDSTGYEAICTAIVTVEDGVPPTITCPANITVSNDLGQCGAIVDYDLTLFDNCSISNLTTTLTEGLPSGAIFPLGTTTNTIVVTDLAGLTDTCSFNVTVIDDEAPEVVCQDITVALDVTGNISILDSDLDGGSTDNCTSNSIPVLIAAHRFDHFLSYIDTDTYTSVSPDIQITFAGNPIHGILGLDLNPIDGLYYTVAYIIDQNDPYLATLDPQTGLVTIIGSNLLENIYSITFTSDGILYGISAFGLFTIDTITGTLSQLLTIDLSENSIAYNPDDGLIYRWSLDNGANSISFKSINPNTLVVTTIPISGYPPYTVSGTQYIGGGEFILVDNYNMEMITMDTTGFSTLIGPSVSYFSGLEFYTIPAGPSTLSFSASQTDFTCDDIGPNTVTLTVTDGSGNASTCSAIVTVEDLIAPDLVCMDITLELESNGTATITPADVIDSSVDNCGILTSAVNIVDFDCSDIGTPVTVTVFVVDNNGNSSTCTSVVTVVDLFAPVVICPPDITVDPGSGNLFYQVPDYFALGEATAVDNCTYPLTILTQDPEPGSLLPDGVYTVTMMAEDEYRNLGTCTFELTVESVLGIYDNNSEDFASIVIYPNPTDNEVYISNPKHINLSDVTLYDLMGRIVSKVDLTNMGTEFTFDVSSLTNAPYFLVIKGSQGIFIKEVIINH